MMVTCTRILFTVIILLAVSALNECSWKSGHNEITARGEEYVKALYGTKLSSNPHDRLPIKDDIRIPNDIPQTFDAREKWRNCRSISAIRNQGPCGSCWAVAPASMISDRICIETNGEVQVNISSENLMTCCQKCYYITGCLGGSPVKALDYFQSTGIVTGGEYESNEGCQPYEHSGNKENIHLCYEYCTNEGYKTPYKQDLHFGNNAYMLPEDDIKAIQIEILKRGPAVAVFSVPSSFKFYKSGVYNCSAEFAYGSHAVRILGWGTEEGNDYWLVANSFGRAWGENGYFKIFRGKYNCGFESNVLATTIKTDKFSTLS